VAESPYGWEFHLDEACKTQETPEEYLFFKEHEISFSKKHFALKSMRFKSMI
jgi:hypothetical protein